MRNIDSKGREWFSHGVGDVCCQATRISNRWYVHGPLGFGSKEDARKRYPGPDCLLDTYDSGLVMVLLPV